MSTLTFVLAAAQLLAPGRDHTDLATAISSRVDAELPLFKDDADRTRTAALVTAILFREGSLGLRVEGDRVDGVPTSWCTAQINLGAGAKTREGWTGPELRDDVNKCVAVHMRMLRESVRACPSAPVALYAVGGPNACSSAHAGRISRDRVALAARLFRQLVAGAKS